MATLSDNLQAAINNIGVQLADMTANPKPSYSVAGRSISWDEHFNALIANQDKLYGLLQKAGGPFEVRTIAR